MQIIEYRKIKTVWNSNQRHAGYNQVAENRKQKIKTILINFKFSLTVGLIMQICVDSTMAVPPLLMTTYYLS